MAGCIFILCKNRRKNTSTSLLLYVIFMIFILFLQQTILYEYKKTKERNFTRNFFTIPQFYFFLYLLCAHSTSDYWSTNGIVALFGIQFFRNFIDIGVRP